MKINYIAYVQRSMLFTVMLTVQVFSQSLSNKQHSCSIVGTVIDARSHEPLAGAIITLIGTAYGDISDSNGTFVIRKIPCERYSVISAMIGYDPDTIRSITMSPDHGDTLTVKMFPCGTAEALRDIAMGKVQYVLAGLNIRLLPQDIEDTLTGKYGFKIIYDDIVGSCFDGYDEAVLDHLDTINGKGWHTRYEHERDSLVQYYDRNSNNDH